MVTNRPLTESRIRRFWPVSLWLVMLMAVCPLSAQYRFDQWTADNGLPQNSVYGMKQTRDGYLWLATMDGLVRFDGVRFTVFNRSNSPGIANNRFISLWEAQNGDLWAATESSGATRLRDGRFTTYATEDGIVRPYNFLLFGDDDENPVRVNYTFGLSRFENDKFRPYELTNSDQPAGPPKIKLVPCPYDDAGRFFKCLMWNRWVKVEVPPTWPGTMTMKGIRDLNNSLWIVIPDAGLFKYDRDGTVKKYREEDGLPGEALFLVPGADKLSVLSKDTQGAIWLTDLTGMRSELISRHPPPAFQTFTCAYEDAEGSLWIGTFRDGLFRLRKQLIRPLSIADGLLNNNVYPVFQDRRGAIWIGTTKGLFKYENEAFALVKGSEDLYIEALGETPDGRLLVGSFDRTKIMLLTVENDQIKPFDYTPPEITYAFFADGDGAVWMGGLYGLIRFKDGQIVKYTEQDGLAGRDVKTIIGDRSGGIWIGSYGGLTHFKDGKFQKWTEAEGWPAPTIRSLYLDGEGVLWIGTYDSGLARFKDGKFTRYSTQNGLFNDGAFQILEDDQRNLWISSNRGVYRVRKDELNELADGRRSVISSIAYGKSDGMLSAECNGGRSPGGIRTRDGKFWFPTQDGIAVVDPAQVRINPQPPPVVIESIKIDNQSISESGIRNSESGMENDRSAILNSKTQIRISPSQQSFEIEYTALSFINSENIRFRYKLEGLDTDWIEAGTRRTAYFSHVAPGDYTFRVIAANADGIWNETGESVRITILPPFYRTWWFLIVSAAATAVIVYVFYKRRILQVERQRLLQQNFSRQLIASQEAERKRIAGELHDGLGQRLVVIKNLIWMTLNAKGKIDESQLREVSDEASQAISEVKTISYNLRPYQLDRMGLTRALEGIIRSAETASEIEFTTEIDNINDYFPKEMEINFYRIVQESVNNILKHSGATNAVITIKREANTIDVVISDNGRGFSTDDNSANPKSQIQNPKSSGFGLIGIRERIELLGGKMEIKSAPNEGTSVIIKLERDRERDLGET